MTKEKAAVFVDNSNVYKGMQAFWKGLFKEYELKKEGLKNLHTGEHLFYCV